MTRVAIIGNAGGGKTTLSRKLSHALGIEVFCIDHVQWKPGWRLASPEEIKRQHDVILERERWIIEGWGTSETIGERFGAADTIILLDHPLYIHYWWTFKRQIRAVFRPSPDDSKGYPMLPVTWPILKTIWNIHRQSRSQLVKIVRSYSGRKQVFHIRSPYQLRRFIKEYCS